MDNVLYLNDDFSEISEDGLLEIDGGSERSYGIGKAIGDFLRGVLDGLTGQ
jgi:hypothetical protein